MKPKHPTPVLLLSLVTILILGLAAERALLLAVSEQMAPAESEQPLVPVPEPPITPPLPVPTIEPPPAVGEQEIPPFMFPAEPPMGQAPCPDEIGVPFIQQPPIGKAPCPNETGIPFVQQSPILEAAQLIDPPTPHVSLRVRVPAQASGGHELKYLLCVENRSQAAAHHVTVRNPLPANADFVRAVPEGQQAGNEFVWRLGTLQPGAVKEITLVLRPTGEGDVFNCARVSFEHGQCVTTRIARPGLAIRKIGPESVTLYDPVAFRIEVTNTGPTPLSDVVLTDILPRELQFESGNPVPERKAMLTWNLGTLAPGQVRIVEYRAVTLKEGTFTNRSVVSAAGGLRREASAKLVVGKAGLSVNITGPERRYANLPANYEINVSNNGSATAGNLVVTVPLPAGARFLTASDGGINTGSEVQWALGALPSGGHKTVKLTLGANAGDIIVKAIVRGDRDLTASAETKTQFQGVTGLSASIKDIDPVEVGQEIPYIVTIQNTGTADATEVKLTATIPVQMQATDAQGPSKATLNGKVVFEPVTIKAGELVRFTVYVKALKPGDVRFRVDIEAKELTAGPLREEESTTIVAE